MSFAVIRGGVDVRTWVRIRRDTTIEWTAHREEVEFTIGGRHGLELLITEDGLRNLLHVGTSALAALEKAQAGQ